MMQKLIWISPEIIQVLKTNNIHTVDELIEIDDFSTISGLTEEMIEQLNEYIEENFEIIEDDEYECPECNAAIPANADKCPSCGIAIVFENEVE